MLSPFKTLGAVLCLVFALSFVAPKAYADSFTFTYTDSHFNSISGRVSSSLQDLLAIVEAHAGQPDTPNCRDVLCGAVSIGDMFQGFMVAGKQTPLLELDDLVVTSQNNHICSMARGIRTGCGSNEVSTGVDLSGVFLMADFITPGTYTNSAGDTLVVAAIPTPEPSSLALMLSGVGLVFGMRKRWGLSQAS